MSGQVLVQIFKSGQVWVQKTYKWLSPCTNILTSGQVLVPLKDICILVPLAQVPLLVEVGLSCKECYFGCCRVAKIKYLELECMTNPSICPYSMFA